MLFTILCQKLECSMAHTTEFRIQDSDGNEAVVWCYMTSGRNMGGAVMVIGARSRPQSQMATKLPGGNWVKRNAANIAGLNVVEAQELSEDERLHVIVQAGSPPEARDTLLAKIARKMLQDYNSS